MAFLLCDDLFAARYHQVFLLQPVLKINFLPFSVAVPGGNLDEYVVQANRKTGKSVHEFF